MPGTLIINGTPATITGFENLMVAAGASVSGRVEQFNSCQSVASEDPSKGPITLVLTDSGFLDLSVRLRGHSAEIHSSYLGGAVSTGSGNDRLIGGVGRDLLWGNHGDDILLGGDGDDALFGGLGSNLLNGGSGDDVYILAGTGDAVVEAENGGVDEVQVRSSYQLGAHLEELLLKGVVAINGTGN